MCTSQHHIQQISPNIYLDPWLPVLVGLTAATRVPDRIGRSANIPNAANEEAQSSYSDANLFNKLAKLKEAVAQFNTHLLKGTNLDFPQDFYFL